MNVFGGYGVPIDLNDRENFLKIRETLTRMGIETFDPVKTRNKDKALVQSCHILHIRGNYAIVHFKELFKMDGRDQFIYNGVLRETEITKDDLARRNAIAFMLQKWGLLTIINPTLIEENQSPLLKIKIIPFRNKSEWTLIEKYSLNRKK